GNANGMIRIKGVIDGVLQEFQVPLKLDDSNAAAAIPTLWARAKIADLLDRTTWQANDRLPNDVRQIALEYGLLSPFTAFLAVDSSMRTAGDIGTSVAVPVPVPDGVRYETTVQQSAATDAARKE